MFISYLFTNIKNVFWTWIILTLLNQIIFFGACLAPYCILASIPHVSLITFGIMYVSYKIALTTYDPKTGYNYLGYDKDGYDINGYGRDGYDRNDYDVKGFDRDGYDRDGFNKFGYDEDGYDIDGYGCNGYDKYGYNQYGYQRDGCDRDGYNRKGINRNGKDRLGKGFFGRMFSSKEHDEKICKMNEEAIKKNTAAQSDAKKMEIIAKANAAARPINARITKLGDIKRDRLTKQHLQEIKELEARIDARRAAAKAAEIDPKAK